VHAGYSRARRLLTPHVVHAGYSPNKPVRLWPNHKNLLETKYNSSSLTYNLILFQKIIEHEATVYCSVFSQDGDYLVCGGSFGKICVWQLSVFLVRVYSSIYLHI
jgi:WD40 repeat protein